MAHEYSMVCVYRPRTEAESGLKTLQAAGVDMKRLSIVGKGYDTEKHPIGYYDRGDRMKYWWKQVIPGIGPVVIASALVSWLVGAIGGAVVVGGLSVLGAGRIGRASRMNSQRRRWHDASWTAEATLHWPEEAVEAAKQLLDASRLTLGFARRFATCAGIAVPLEGARSASQR